jgi:hypothetical protein
MSEPGPHLAMVVLEMTGKSTHLETAMNRITTIILTSALAAGAQIAHAADPTDASLRHVKVLFSDLNLTSIDGAKTLYRRLQGAAESDVSTDFVGQIIASTFHRGAPQNPYPSAVPIRGPQAVNANVIGITPAFDPVSLQLGQVEYGIPLCALQQ